ncbi:MAG: phosphoglycerate dehydrogenase [Planctomycetota bacterium]
MKTSFPKDRLGVTLLEGIHPRGGELFSEHGYASVRTEKGALEGEPLASALAEARVIGIRSKTTLTAGALEAAPHLLAVGCFCIGTNQVDLDACRRLGIAVFNSPFSNTRSVAELVVSELIALSRRLFDKSRDLHAGKWDKSAEGAHEVRGMTLGIVGYGHIGSQVSVLAESMGMRVIFYDLIPKLPLGNARQVGSLDELLAESDAVTLHVPADVTTQQLMGADELGKMKPGALLLNNARGSVVDLDALANALRSGALGGAALDVFPTEPAKRGDPFDSPLQGLDNVILTPHIGGSTVEAQRAIAEDVTTKLVRYVDTGSTTGSVNIPEVELPGQQRAEGARTHRVLHLHRNVPGVLNQINQLTTELGANVTGQYLRTDADIGYVVLDVDAMDEAAVRMGLEAIPETIRTRVLW